ncbi:MAG: rRNA maturation RNase YbeY, partial [Alphaproteobacteria bacterium]|nr:rRNA maturation RNase YbeY [Alphaproteobacteria bacterium]
SLSPRLTLQLVIDHAPTHREKNDATDHWQKGDIAMVQKNLARLYPLIKNAPHRARVEVLFTDKAAMRQLKKKFFGRAASANVLSFPSGDATSPFHPKKNTLFLGSIALSYQTIKNEARKQQKEFHDHLLHLALHGLLHLLGHDHQQTRQATTMEALEIQLLNTIAIANPYDSNSNQYKK